MLPPSFSFTAYRCSLLVSSLYQGELPLINNIALTLTTPLSYFIIECEFLCSSPSSHFSDSRALTCMRRLCLSLVTHLMPRGTSGGPLAFARLSGSATKGVGAGASADVPMIAFPRSQAVFSVPPVHTGRLVLVRLLYRTVAGHLSF